MRCDVIAQTFCTGLKSILFKSFYCLNVAIGINSHIFFLSLQAQNRFKVPLGTKFYRVKAVAWNRKV